MKTKEKIIKAAINLYNTGGLNSVTSRHIAASIGISHGNLDYHFPNKEAILHAIYDKMKEEASKMYPLADPDIDSFEHFDALLKRLDSFHYKFKFFTTDIQEINRNYPTLRARLSDSLILRKHQTADLFTMFIDQGFLEKDVNESYERLQHIIRIIITYWMPQSEVLTVFKYNEKGQMVKHIWELLKPYMTERGKKRFEALEALNVEY